jgi:hypothetical protein
MGRETGHLQLLASLLLTGGKGTDLVIRGNVVLNLNSSEMFNIQFIVHIVQLGTIPTATLMQQPVSNSTHALCRAGSHNLSRLYET